MVPKGWKRGHIDDVATVITSGSRGWAQHYSDSGAKFIRMTNLSRGGIRLLLNDLKYVNLPSNSSEGKRTALRNGDILISITAELGKIGLVPENLGEAYVNQHVALVRISKKVADSEFIAFQLSSAKGNHEINQLNDAGSKAALNLKTVSRIPISLPPLNEQKQIASILATWDNAITTTERLLANTEQQKNALMQHLLTGKKRLPGFGGEWQQVRFSDVLDIEVGGTPSRSNPDYWDVEKKTDNRWLSIANLKGSRIYDTTEYLSDLGVKNSNVKLIPAGTIVMSFKLTIGRRAMLMNDCYTNEAICALLIKDKNQLDNDYLYHALDVVRFDAELDQAVKGSTLNKAKLKRLLLPLPPLDEQKAISSVLNDADRECELNHRRLNCLKQEKKALMQQLLTGRRRVKVDTNNRKEASNA